MRPQTRNPMNEKQSETTGFDAALIRHSQMLGQIASEVEQWCISDKATTLDAVQYLKADWMRLKGIVELKKIEERIADAGAGCS